MDQPILRKFTLAGPGGDGRHAYLNEHGAFIGAAVPLLERDAGGRWQARDRRVLAHLFANGYGHAGEMERRMRQLDRVAHALNRGEPALASISLVHAALPPLADEEAAWAMAESDTLLKGGWDDELRVPEGNPEGGEWTTGGGDTGSNTAAPKDLPRAVQATRPDAKKEKIVIQNSDGSKEVRSGGSRAWRNNNPGNLGPTPLARRHGSIGNDGERAIFPDEATGMAAQKALLLGTYGDGTLDEMVGHWADPKKDDVPAYKARIRLWTGLSGKEKIKDLTADQLAAVMAAQRRQEGWVVGTVSQKGS